MSESLSLIQLGPTLDYPLKRLREDVERKFPDYRVTTIDHMETPAMAYNSSRNQYHSTRILAILEERTQPDPLAHILGVASFDLYVPGMNYVFGEARCPGRAAVISTYRLKADDAEDVSLFQGRVVKEAVHEIGHMAGLKHCSEASCVMFFSERLADTDRKKDNFCSECERKMKWLEIE
jgi:archaemetzincin